MKRIIPNKKIRVAVLSFAFLLVPVFAYGESLIPCGQPAGTPNITVNGVSVVTTEPCEFNHLLVLSNTIIKFLMFTVAVPLAALGFMWAGANLVLNQEKEKAWSEAKGRFTDIAIGFGIMLGAYVLIKGVIFSFLAPDQITFMNFMFQ